MDSSSSAAMPWFRSLPHQREIVGLKNVTPMAKLSLAIHNQMGLQIITYTNQMQVSWVVAPQLQCNGSGAQREMVGLKK